MSKYLLHGDVHVYFSNLLNSGIIRDNVSNGPIIASLKEIHCLIDCIT